MQDLATEHQLQLQCHLTPFMVGPIEPVQESDMSFFSLSNFLHFKRFKRGFETAMLKNRNKCTVKSGNFGVFFAKILFCLKMNMNTHHFDPLWCCLKLGPRCWQCPFWILPTPRPLFFNFLTSEATKLQQGWAISSVLHPFYYECRFPRTPANFVLQNNFKKRQKPI